MSDDFPPFLNEAAVELRVICPLLLRLGHTPENIVPKYPIVFRHGRRGRKPEADFVVFSGEPHGRHTSLIVVEAKKPGEPILDAKEQAESYQHAIRAPFTLIVDGCTLEVWQYQPADESECVITIDLTALEVDYGRLSLILSRDAAIAHCERLRKPNVAQAIDNWTDYTDAELDRLDAMGPLIERALLDENRRQIASDTILANASGGAVITGKSGFGKTSLCVDLLRLALNGYKNGDPTPVHVPLADLGAGETVLSFVTARLNAKKPGFVVETLRKRMKEQGVDLFLDSFDRLAPADAMRIEAEIRILKRDYPKTRAFVFSRKDVSPLPECPRLDLLPLTGQQQFELIEAKGNLDLRRGWRMTTELLRDLCRIPLLLQLSMQQYERSRQWPSKLVDIFDAWLESTINPDQCPPSQKIVREETLRILASVRSVGPLTVGAALSALKANGIEPALLDELVQCGALSVRHRNVSFPHEALADYVEALSLAAQPNVGAVDLLRNRHLEPDSFFPVLLMSVSKSSALRKELWNRLGAYGLRSYIDVLRYQSDISEEISIRDPAKFAEMYLGELLEGIEQPLNAFFPQLAPFVHLELADEDCAALRVIGQAAPNWVHYAFMPASADHDRVEIDDPRHVPQIHYVNLTLSQLRPNSGRLVGAQLLRKTIDSVITRQDLAAGPILAGERLLGRLRYLAKEHEPSFATASTIDGFEHFLEPHRGQFVRTSPRVSRSNGFFVDAMLDDLVVLKNAGLPLPKPWWRRDGRDIEPDPGNSEEIAFALDAHYRIAQQVYAEIVELNFAGIAGVLPFFAILPVRWTVSVESSSRGQDWPHFHSYKYLPVADWPAAGADVVPKTNERRTFDPSHAVEVRKLLEKLGRRHRNGAIWQGAGSLMTFDGINRDGWFDGQTSAYRTAFGWLRKDLEAVFSELPAN